MRNAWTTWYIKKSQFLLDTSAHTHKIQGAYWYEIKKMNDTDASTSIPNRTKENKYSVYKEFGPERRRAVTTRTPTTWIADRYWDTPKENYLHNIDRSPKWRGADGSREDYEIQFHRWTQEMRQRYHLYMDPHCCINKPTYKVYQTLSVGSTIP